MDARALIQARRGEIMAKIAAREGVTGYKQNVEECKTALRELDRILELMGD
jgi:hypothetical protein